MITGRYWRFHPREESNHPEIGPFLALAEYLIASLARGISSPRGFAGITLRKSEEIVT